MTPPRILMTVLFLLGTTACGGDDLEVRLEEAAQRLSDGQAEVEQAQARVDEKITAAAQAQDDLQAAHEDLREAESRLTALQEEVNLSATDDVVFRTVQSRLLDDDDLEDVAISANVENGVVTLSGEVEEEELRERAKDIARRTPGVVMVENQIKLLPAVSAPQ